MYKYENFIGKVLDGRYKILELVGLGGMAFVLKAEDLVMNRIVAIKILNDEYNGNEQAETRFINESKAVAMLSNKNIVSIYDVAIYPDIKYIVMEFLDGITLREYLDNKGALPWKEACVYTLQILRALEHAHSKDVIHRDIKPQNVILQKNGEIKVTDFGIAKIPNTPTLTLTEKAIGTVYYISPEQASGKETGFSSDIYSVGIMLYEAVTGKLPFTADSPLSIAMMQVRDKAVPPRELMPSLPEGVNQIIQKSMEKDPTERFSSAHSMRKAIEWVLRNPEVVFLMKQEEGEHESADPAAVSIDMIDTGEIQDYGEREIAEILQLPATKQQKPPRAKKPKSPKKEKERSRSMFPIIAGVAIPFLIVALIIGAIFVVQLIKSIFDETDTNVAVFPDLVGKTWDSQLESQLANGKFEARFKVSKINYVETDDYQSGQIIEQSPPAKSERKQTDATGKYYYFDYLTVCKNIDDVAVPDVTYQSQRQAELALEKDPYRFKVTTTTESNTDFFDGQVIRTEPPQGSLVSTGETITLIVCRRAAPKNTDKMPDLVGLSQTQAENLIKYTKYDYTFELVKSFDGTNKVISQSITKNQINPAGTHVTITVSVKTSGFAMPDFVYMTYPEATGIITGMGLSVEDYSTIYLLQGDTLPRYQTVGLEYNEAVQFLQDIGYEFTSQVSDSAVVLYQNIPAEVTIDNEAEICLIFGIYIEE